MKTKDQGNIGRREFLRVMGLSVGAGAGLAVAATAPLVTEAQAAESMQEAKKKRYNPNSEDVKNFYRVNRY
jgi:DMSO/TMAO reductase YedYZ molybdopterin-dependent catalytic subunit